MNIIDTMKILQISRQFFPSTGGIENVMYCLSRALQQKGYCSDTVTLRSIFNTGEIADAESFVDGLKVYRLPHIGIKRYPIAPEVISFVSSYDILHIHAIDFFIDFLSLTRPFHHKPVIINTHGGIFHTQWLVYLKQFYFRIFTRLSLRGTDAIICVSKQDYDLFRTIAPEHKLHIVSNGVNVEPFLTINKQIVPGLLVGIGRIVKHKCIERLISFLPILAKDFPKVHLIWVGNDPEKRIPQLLAYAQQLGVESRVNFVGQIPDQKVQDLLSQAHLFVSTAEYEGFGLSTIEAMSSATVPVVTPVGVHPEVVREGKTGFIYGFEEQQALECFRYVLSLDENQINQIGNNARETAKQYSWSRVVNSYLAIYESVLSKKLSKSTA
jgi:alpha-1,3-mannosyltransferase